jgi:ribosomal protein L37AE/L43A
MSTLVPRRPCDLCHVNAAQRIGGHGEWLCNACHADHELGEQLAPGATDEPFAATEQDSRATQDAPQPNV